MNQKRATRKKTAYTVGLCAVANFINAADRVIMPIAIIPMQQEFQWSLHWQGWILSAFAFGYFTSQVILALLTGCFARWEGVFLMTNLRLFCLEL